MLKFPVAVENEMENSISKLNKFSYKVISANSMAIFYNSEIYFHKFCLNFVANEASNNNEMQCRLQCGSTLFSFDLQSESLPKELLLLELFASTVAFRKKSIDPIIETYTSNLLYTGKEENPSFLRKFQYLPLQSTFTFTCSDIISVLVYIIKKYASYFEVMYNVGLYQNITCNRYAWSAHDEKLLVKADDPSITVTISTMPLIVVTVMINISFAKLSPLIFVNDEHVKDCMEYKNNIFERLKSEKWVENKSLVDNLSNILQFPLNLMDSNAYQAMEQNSAEPTCSICCCEFDDMDDGSNTAQITCPNAKCALLFHKNCLRKWLISCKDVKYSFGMIFGTCPYCQKGLSISS